jgi:hypothetical protein
MKFILGFLLGLAVGLGLFWLLMPAPMGGESKIDNLRLEPWQESSPDTGTGSVTSSRASATESLDATPFEDFVVDPGTMSFAELDSAIDQLSVKWQAYMSPQVMDQMHVLVDRMTLMDPLAALKLISENRRLAGLERRVMRVWYSVDPESAIAHFVSTSGDDMSFGDWLISQEGIESSSMFEDIRQKLGPYRVDRQLQVLALKGLSSQEMFRVASGYPRSQRLNIYWQALEKLTQDEANLAPELISQIANEKDRQRVFRTYFQTMAKDPVRTEYIAERYAPGDQTVKRLAMEMVSRSTSDDALGILQGHAEDSGDYRQLEAYIGNRARSSVADALALAEPLPARSHERVFMRIANEMVSRDPHAASAWASALPGKDVKVRDHTFTQLAQRVPGIAQDLHTQMRDGELRTFLAGQIALRLARDDQDEAMAFAREHGVSAEVVNKIQSNKKN